MDNKELRRAAAKEFMESLEEELKENLTPESPPERKKKPLPKPTPIDRPSAKKEKVTNFTLSELEEAIEDIDHYMEQQHQPNSQADN